ncbi:MULTISPECIES: alanine--glyoxylate aminotransferase family protein [unclassified Achromobacter]|uniref:pyridoxal-phosphate-dependent aminotransferase family protein n=1 Tax=unclassified Achromobacter TaxID=2626865 RepID=UPI000B519A7B|nr:MULTISPECIES: aminotransferase class V-fold PLP-dependent enzyme [unclassified Achromobacter]OWT74618.1 serine--glyoxylate aminotransferase [Achromobacter sp. HZ34]OWT79085.1 serine--glyoxylate aminotransferase [Achromobacter sp. HZ28]
MTFRAPYRGGRHFLQIPGPSNVPDRILRAIDQPTIDHRGPQFQVLARKILADLGELFGTTQPVMVYPASGTGAWEAALVNTLAAGDQVLMYETGQFATLWQNLARKLGLVTETLPGDWRHGVDAAVIEQRLREDREHRIKAVCIVHNETSTGVLSNVPAVRQAMDRAGHPALLMVDTVSSLGAVEYRHDDWGVDVTISGSQKGMMLPAGLSFNAVSAKALAAAASGGMPRSYWNWQDIIQANEKGSWPYTPATNLLYGLSEACDMLREAGLAQVHARHVRHGAAARAAVAAWGLENNCVDPAEYSPVLTTVRMPEGHDADAFRAIVLDRFDMSLGQGLGKLSGKVFRIGHLGDFNDLSLMGTLAGVEMGLALAGVPHQPGGVAAAMEVLREHAAS